jgi:tRNA-specific 2-thiouridylase
MRNWSPLSEIKNFCPWQQDYEDVRRVCQHLNIPYATFNFEKEYKERVLNYFLREYQAGRTPNPDVLCNREIKFDLFLKNARALGFDYVATGHYAKVEKIDNGKNSRFALVRPKDTEKDQTYFLCHLTQEQLRHAIFPLADLTKAEVREIAKRAGLPNADKKDSQGICFIGKLPVREFLKTNLKLEPGKVITSSGQVLGMHEGAQLYTIGQRHIGVPTNGKPMYVAKKDITANTIVVDEEQALYSNALSFADANWLEDLPETFDCDVQLRYRTRAIPAKVYKNGSIELQIPARAVTAGQFAAFYKDGRLVGGAVIS